MSKAIVISQPYFFPWVGLFEQIKLADVFVHFDDVQFVNRHFQDRVQIKTREGFMWLTVPKVKHKQETPINEIRIDNSQNWKMHHLTLLKNHYTEAPYFKEMFAIVENIYRHKYDFLCDLTIKSIMEVADYFNLIEGKQFLRSSELNISGKSTNRLLNIVDHFNAECYITAMGALKYLDFNLFEQKSIKVEFINYQKKIYPQLFGPFNPFVSILDLLANVGSDGIKYICSNTLYWKDFINTDQAKNYIKCN